MENLDRLLPRITLAAPDRARIDVIAPFTGKALAQISLGEPADVALAMGRRVTLSTAGRRAAPTT